MGEKLTAYDPAEDLQSDEAIAVFMEEAFKTEDAGYIAHALGVVARAKGMTQIANEPGFRVSNFIARSVRMEIRH